jgi:hypothetical protein
VAERVRRRWTVGILTCEDVQDLQKRINAYRVGLEDSIDALPADRKLSGVGPRSQQAWTALRDRCNTYEDETCWAGALGPLFVGSQFDRGKALVTELDGWRDYLASLAVPAVTSTLPAPIPTPKSDVSLFGAVENVGLLLAGIAVLYLLKR